MSHQVASWQAGRLLLALLIACLNCTSGLAQLPADIRNYRELSAVLATAGQPAAAQFELIRDAGFERVINLAFSNDRNAVAGEDRIVRELGMEYVHVPVLWEAPTADDFETLAAILLQQPDKKTLLHCQLNMRASAFAMVYRVVYEGVPLVEAKAEMNEVWQPDGRWRELIFELLQAHGVPPQCESCDWGP
jgi:protein tyrosine phosphatase (PTP) superfamily phosphohydrolase (DUF442 family)